MELVDLCSAENWKVLEDEIRKRSGLNAAVFNVDGVRINESSQWSNRLCPEIKAEPKGQSFICATAHMNIANQARQSGQTVIEECDAGMIKLVVPVFVNGTFLGAVGGCGYLLDDGEVDTFLVNKTTDIDEERVAQLAEGIPSISTEKAQELSSFIQNQVDRIVGDYLAGNS